MKSLKPPPFVIRKVDSPICPYANVRYSYQPQELLTFRSMIRVTDPILFVDVHILDYHIITQGLLVYYLKAPAPKRRVVRREQLIVPGVCML